MKTTGALALLAAAAVLVLSSLACCCGVPIDTEGGWRVGWPWRSVRGSGDVVEVRRDVAGFSGIELRGVGHLYIEQDESEELRIEAEDNLLQYIESRLEGTTLVIGTQSGVNLRPTRPIIFRVTLRDLDSLVISGSGSAEGADVEAGDLSITVSGSGEASLTDLEADRLRVRISGSGNVDVSGRAETQDLTISGSGEYRAIDLDSEEAEVRVSGSGSATLRVSSRLDASISGSGSVRYAGSPVVESRITGSGSVRQIGD
jgi:hypothetical protein